jgi:hypothetical protein
MYSMKEWKILMDANDYSDQLFTIFERQLSKKFFMDKLKLNPSKDPPPKSFMDMLKRWNSNKNPQGVMVDALVLDNSYKCQEVCFKALLAILQPLITDRVSIVNIYGGGALLLLELVN